MSKRVRTSKKLWSNDKWVVTTYGIECITDTYIIAKNRLLEGLNSKWTWVDQLSGKAWTTREEFEPAYLKALEIYFPNHVKDYHHVKFSTH